MTFEEFFIKKRVDLSALAKAEPALFSEFKTHFGQMGEKSFDHTKKYWFNKLRRRFHLAPELKPEKTAIANPLAQQTITESLTEQSPALQPAKQGFVPRFKAGNRTKPPGAEDTAEEKPAGNEPTVAPVTPKPGFTTRFKASNLPKPAVVEKPNEEEEAINPAPATPPAKVSFTPRFKAANMAKPAFTEPADIQKTTEEKPAATAPETEEKTTEISSSKPGFKPRFNMKNMPPKKEE
jgi:hypothetical protein